MHPFARALSGVSSLSQVDRLSLVSRLSLSVCYNTCRPRVLQVFTHTEDHVRHRQLSRLNADHSALPLAYNLIRPL